MKEHFDEKEEIFEINTSSKQEEDNLNKNQTMIKGDLLDEKHLIMPGASKKKEADVEEDRKEKNIQKLGDKREEVKKNMPESLPSDFIDDLKQKNPLFENIDAKVSSIISDKKSASYYKKVIAAAKVYQLRKNSKDQPQLLLALREALSNYLKEHKGENTRKEQCRGLISDIDNLVEQEGLPKFHDPSYMLDDYQLSDSQIDMEIMLKHAKLGKSADSFSEVSRERRNEVKSRLEDVRIAKRILTDINRKDTAKRLAFDKAGFGEDTDNTAYDKASREAVLAYSRLHDMSEQEAVDMLLRMRPNGLDENIDERSVKTRQIEMLMMEVMSWKPEEFSFEKSKDFLHRRGEDQNEVIHFKRMKAKLDFVKNAKALLDEIDKDTIAHIPTVFSDSVIAEMRARIEFYTGISNEYDERLSIMGTTDYALMSKDEALLQKKDIAYKRGKNFDKLWKKEREEEAEDNGFDQKKYESECESSKSLLISSLKELYGDETASKMMAAMIQKPVLRSAKEEQDLIDRNMRNIQDRAFIPVGRKRSERGVFSAMKDVLGLGLRYLVGAPIGIIANLVGNVYSAISHKGPKTDDKETQILRQHDTVPGMKGEKFTDEDISNDDDETRILEDTRRGPMIWEKLTAGDPEDPPEICLMSRQATRGSHIANNGGDGGHSFMALNYSRYNRATGRKERYRLTVGFYNGAGAGKLSTQLIGTRGAMGLGKMKNDHIQVYDVGRRFQIKPGDVNKVIRAINAYSDGGYGLYNRNCATFVAEMAKLTNLPIVEDLKEEKFDMGLGGGMLLNTAIGFGNAGYVGAKNNIQDKLVKKDISYMNYGQKLATEDEVKRYKDTSTNISVDMKGYNPSTLGETLLGTNKGELISRRKDYWDKVKKPDDAFMAIGMTGKSFVDKLKKSIPEAQRTEEDIQFYTEIGEFIDKYGKTGQGKLNLNNPETAKNVHKEISTMMKRSNAYYSGRMQNEGATQNLFLAFLTVCEAGLWYCDLKYNKSVKKIMVGDATSARTGFDTKTNCNIKYAEKGKKGFQAVITPALFEGCLMMGMKPQEILEMRYRQTVLTKKEKDIKKDKITEKWTDADKAELADIERKFGVAEDFASACKYYMNAQKYTKSNLRYVFSELPKLESETPKGVTISGGLFSEGHKPSDYHQTAILETIFNGLEDIEYPKWDDGKEEEFAKKVTDHLVTCGFRRQRSLEDVLEAFSYGKEGVSVNKLADDFLRISITSYIRFVFEDDLNEKSVDYIKIVTDHVSKDKDFKALIRSCIKEKRQDLPENDEYDVNNINNIDDIKEVVDLEKELKKDDDDDLLWN